MPKPTVGEKCGITAIPSVHDHVFPLPWTEKSRSTFPWTNPTSNTHMVHLPEPLDQPLPNCSASLLPKSP